MARYLLGSRDIAKTLRHFLSVTSFHFSVIAANIYQLLRRRSLRRWVFSRFLARLFTLLLFPPSFSVIIFTKNKKIKNVKRDPPPLDFNSFPRNSKFSFCSPNWLCMCSGYLLVLNLIFGLFFLLFVWFHCSAWSGPSRDDTQHPVHVTNDFQRAPDASPPHERGTHLVSLFFLLSFYVSSFGYFFCYPAAAFLFFEMSGRLSHHSSSLCFRRDR